MRDKRFGNLLRILVSLILLAILLKTVDVGETIAILRRTDPGYFLAALALYLAGIVLRAYRWQGLLDALGVQTSLVRLTDLYLVGTFFSKFLPTGVGGDVVRAFEIAQDSRQAAAAVSSVVVDRASGLLMLMAMGLAALPFAQDLVTPRLTWFVAMISLSTFAAVGLVMTPGLWRALTARLGWAQRLAERRMVRDLAGTVQRYGTRALVQALAISAIFNLLLIAVVYLIALSLGVRISPLYFVLFVPLISLSLLVPSISGFGVREGAFVYLFTQAGVAGPRALGMGLGFYAVDLITGLLGGLLYLVQGLRGYQSMRPASGDTETQRSGDAEKERY